MLQERRRGITGIGIAGLLLLLLISSFWLVYAASTDSAPVIPPAKGEQCVADTALMRKDHMKLLNHQRDETVIDGIRGNPFSLVECVNCHAQVSADGTPVRIDDEGQFCESCHTYAAVKIDCFTCHAAVPEQAEIIGLQQFSGDHTTASIEWLDTHWSETATPIYNTERYGKPNKR